MQITMFTADCTGQAANCSYPNRRVVTTPEEMQEAVGSIMFAQSTKVTIEASETLPGRMWW